MKKTNKQKAEERELQDIINMVKGGPPSPRLIRSSKKIFEALDNLNLDKL
jgi:hypothetical protein